MRIDLPASASRVQVRAALRRAVEALKPKTPFVRSQAIIRHERARVRDKVRGTNTLEIELRKVLAQWATDFFARAKLKRAREADDEDRQPQEYQGLTAAERDAVLGAVNAISGDSLGQSLADAAATAYDQGQHHAHVEINPGRDMDPLILENPGALRAIQNRAFDFATDVADSQKAVLRSLILDAFNTHTTVDDLAGQIAEFFADGVHRRDAAGNVRTFDVDAWSNTVARTEVTQAQNSGIRAYYADAQIRRIMWIAAADACDDCQDLDGETTELGTPFPGSDSADAPPNHPRCRCTIIAAGDDFGNTDNPFGVGQAAADGDDG